MHSGDAVKTASSKRNDSRTKLQTFELQRIGKLRDGIHLKFAHFHAVACRVLVVSLVISVGGRLTAEDKQPELHPVADRVVQDVVPLLTKYCTGCHNAKDQASGLDLTPFHDELSLLKERRTWQGVQRVLRSSEMPPKDKPQPSADERQALVALIDEVLNKIDCDKQKNPGRVTIRRLNR